MSAWDDTSADNGDDGSMVIPGSRRPDGTYRKDVKVRAGYVPQDEVPKFISPGCAFETRRAADPLPGFSVAAQPQPKMSQSQKKAAARQKKRAAKQQQKAEGGGSASPAAKEKTTKDSQPPAQQGPPIQNKIKGVQKKIKQTEQLVEKKEAGQKLNADQLTKIDRLEELRSELAALQLQAED